MDIEDSVRDYIEEDRENLKFNISQLTKNQSFFNERSNFSDKRNVRAGVGLLLLSIPISFLTTAGATFLAALAVVCLVAGIVKGMDCSSSNASTLDP